MDGKFGNTGIMVLCIMLTLLAYYRLQLVCDHFV